MRPLLPCALLLVACGSTPIATKTVGATDASRRVLIASLDSEFKNAVVKRVVKTLETERVFIKIVDLSTLSPGACKAFDAVVIVNEWHFFRMDGKARSFRDGLSKRDKKKIVMLITAGTPSTVSEVPGVDAISGASEPADADAVAKKIVDRLRPILARGG